MKQIHIIGGGTVSHVRNHLALCAPAYGTTARKLEDILLMNDDVIDYGIELHLTKMADRHSQLETNEDISKLVDKLVADSDTKIIFFNPALVDYEGSITTSGPIGYEWSDDITTPSGKYETRLETSKGEQSMLLWSSKKIIGKIRQERKDIFLVAFKTTCGATQDEQFLTGLHLLKTNSCNLVLANDTKTRMNMIITPEQSRYVVTQDREVVLNALVDMAISRSQGTFTRTTVVPGEPVPWNADMVPLPLKKVVDHCIKRGAYKAFNGATVGHFAYKTGPNTFVTSKRKVDFNKLKEVGMVFCESSGPDKVIAHGFRPSVGGQSQRIIFKDHPETDCIVHFHCPPKPGVKLSIRSQFENECGSHQCGKNTSLGLKEEAPGIYCVYLDNHGPNIVFNKKTNPEDVVKFIEQNFDLSKSTDQLDHIQVS